VAELFVVNLGNEYETQPEGTRDLLNSSTSSFRRVQFELYLVGKGYFGVKQAYASRIVPGYSPGLNGPWAHR
jgi:hypothetical protein